MKPNELPTGHDNENPLQQAYRALRKLEEPFGTPGKDRLRLRDGNEMRVETNHIAETIRQCAIKENTRVDEVAQLQAAVRRGNDRVYDLREQLADAQRRLFICGGMFIFILVTQIATLVLA